MCGIIGYWSFSNPMSASNILPLLSAQSHRGPDGCGLVLYSQPETSPKVWKARDTKSLTSKLQKESGCLWLGHNWLAIQDKSQHAQMPMFSNDRRYCLVYNGEIYNFKNIREDMINEGHHFITGSDAEVLLKAWEIKGPDVLQSLRGMFAFLLFDSAKQTLWAVRDPLGIKPLYYTELSGGIAFASEIRSFHEGNLVRRSFVDDAVIAFLVAGINKPNESSTIYDTIQELPPGKMIMVKDNDIMIESYAIFPELNPVLTDEDAVSIMRKTILDSVSVHLISKVPVASCMSGGLDSTNIAAAIKRLNPGPSCPYTVFTIGAETDEDPDLLLAKQTAEVLQIPHKVYKRPSYISVLDIVNMVITCEMPNHVIGPINQYLLLRYISSDPKGIKVVLDGQGGDELLSGYPWFNKFLIDEIKKTNPKLARNLSIKYYNNLPLPKLLHDNLVSMFHDPKIWVEKFDNGMSSLLNITSEDVLKLDPAKFYLSNSNNWNEFRRREYFQSELQYLLRQEDRIGMHFGLECRIPYVDIPSIEIAALLKPEFLIKDGLLKYPLRVLFPELPGEVRWNTHKRGFWDIPGEAFPYLRMLSENAVIISPYINELVRQGGGDISRVKNIGDSALWRLLQIAILEECSTSDIGLQWLLQFDQTYLADGQQVDK